MINFSFLDIRDYLIGGKNEDCGVIDMMNDAVDIVAGYDSSYEHKVVLCEARVNDDVISHFLVIINYYKVNGSVSKLAIGDLSDGGFIRTHEAEVIEFVNNNSGNYPEDKLFDIFKV